VPSALKSSWVKIGIRNNHISPEKAIITYPNLFCSTEGATTDSGIVAYFD
jgi:hypothetical protein